MKITVVLALTALIFLSSCNLALAQQDDIGQSVIHPAHPLYFLKTIREILELKFAGTSNIRGLRHLEFATRRIREIKSLIQINQPDLIPPTLENYWFNLGKVSGLLSFRDDALASQVLDEIKQQQSILQKLYDQIEDRRAKMAIRTTIYRISQWNIQLLDRLTLEDKRKVTPKLAASQASACDFLTKEATSSALNEVEKVVFFERADKCHQSSNLLR